MLIPILSVSFFLVLCACILATEPQAATTRSAIFSGGCFWCMEEPFASVPGVLEVSAGYCGGAGANPTYEEVCSGRTGHRESVRVIYDPSQVTYSQLLEIFWRNIDPTDPGGQFADRGDHYRTAIFVQDEEQQLEAERSKAALGSSGVFSRPIATEILPARPFYPAEDYHQDYYQKNIAHYRAYKVGSGRAGFLHATWQERREPAAYLRESDQSLRQRLTPMQFEVTRKDGTEPPFTNEYWDNKRAGIYVDIVSGQALFSSADKFDSGTGWPSFTRPLVAEHIVERRDSKLLTPRTEVRSSLADSHLGHVFPDGPPPTGLRYCINSAALEFIELEEMQTRGYGEYLAKVQKGEDYSA